jgi:hypothetical protein
MGGEEYGDWIQPITGVSGEEMSEPWDSDSLNYIDLFSDIALKDLHHQACLSLQGPSPLSVVIGILTTLHLVIPATQVILTRL